MAREKEVSCALLFICMISMVVGTIVTPVTVNTQSAHEIVVRFYNPLSYAEYANFNGTSDSVGRYTINYNSDVQYLLAVYVQAKKNGKIIAYGRFGNYSTGDTIYINLDNPAKSTPGTVGSNLSAKIVPVTPIANITNTTANVTNSTKTNTTNTANTTSAAAVNKTNSTPVVAPTPAKTETSPEGPGFFSKTYDSYIKPYLKYIIIVIVVIVVIVVIYKLKKRGLECHFENEDDDDHVSVVKLSEKKQREESIVLNSREKQEIVEAEEKIKEAQEKINAIKNKQNRIDEAKKKYEEARKEYDRAIRR